MNDDILKNTRTTELIERISKLVPYNEDKVKYLETLISYVDALINGDDIHQYITYAYTSKYAKEALKEIMEETHARILESYRQERKQLTEDVEGLKTRKSNLDSQVQSLEDQKNGLVKRTSSLSIELETIKKELEDLRNNGIAKVNEEFSGERKRLTDEVTSLNKQKNILTTSIGELKKVIDSYNKTIDNLSKKDEKVVWIPIDENSPVYSLNKYTISDYIESLIVEYMSIANIPYDNAEQTIRYNCQGLYSIQNILKNQFFCTTSLREANISAIINTKKCESLDENKIKSIIEALKTIKLPVSKKNNANIDTYGLNPDTIPTDINTMLRELHLQRTLAEALAKQKILEKELEIVVSILKSVSPKEDLKQYLQPLEDLDKFANSDTQKLQL